MEGGVADFNRLLSCSVLICASFFKGFHTVYAEKNAKMNTFQHDEEPTLECMATLADYYADDVGV